MTPVPNGECHADDSADVKEPADGPGDVRPFVHRRVLGLSALRSLISCKRSSRRWNEKSPCCRNGKRGWKRNLNNYAQEYVYWLPLGVFLHSTVLGLLVLWMCLDPQDIASALLLCLAVMLSLAALSLWTSAARIFFFAASAVQFYDGRSWHVLEASAVTSWATLVWS